MQWTSPYKDTLSPPRTGPAPAVQGPLDMFTHVHYVARTIGKAGGWHSTGMPSCYFINREIVIPTQPLSFAQQHQ